ncbi:MAG: ABC transporter substrate-binding protein [Deltaproteobacteria bacterium]|nr:ABC transporter substrate-binding protein [Deltaproteobacteria bacterium]
MRRLALALGLLAACDQGDRGPRWRPAGNLTPRRGGELRYASKDQVRTLDPAIAYDEVSSFALHPMFDTLLDYEPDGVGLVERLAARWTLSPDKLVYTFELRDGITYSDGGPIVAGDFEYSLERVLRMPSSPFGAFLGDVVGAAEVIAGTATDCAGIVATSDRELVIRLARPNTAFKYILAMTFSTPLRRAHVVAAGEDIRRLPLESGPYMLAAWDEGERLVLTRNPHYTIPDRGYLDTITMLENIARDTQFLMFEKGELDTAERLSAPDLLWITSQPAWQPYVRQQPMLNAFGSRMNVRVPPFDSKLVRQALNYALDKQSSVKLLNGTAVVSHGLLPPGLAGRDATLAPYPHDPAKARALLAQAGYPDGFDLDYVVMADEEAEKLAASLQGDLAQVGVRVHIQLMSFATYIGAIGKRDGAPFSKATWIGDYPDATNFLDARFHSRMIADENSTNDSFYANPVLDRLLDDARAETDEAVRAALYRKAEAILHDDAPWIWDYHQLMTEVAQPYVRDGGPHPIWSRDYTRAWLDVDPSGRPVPR